MLNRMLNFMKLRYFLLFVFITFTSAPCHANLIVGQTTLNYIKNGVTILNGLNAIFSLVSKIGGGTLEPSLVITFTEYDDEMSLTMAGGDVTADFSEAFAITGAYWSGSIAVTLDTGVIYDEVTTSGSFVHINGPDDDDRLGGPMIYNMRINGFFPPPFNPSKTVDVPKTTGHRNKHTDVWNGDITANIDILSNIKTWGGFIKSVHVPTPSTLSLMIIGLFALLKSRPRIQCHFTKTKAAL